MRRKISSRASLYHIAGLSTEFAAKFTPIAGSYCNTPCKFLWQC